MIAIQIILVVFLAAFLIRYADILLLLLFSLAGLATAVIVAWAIIQVIMGVLI